MSSAQDILTRAGFSNVGDLIKAAAATGLPLGIAAALIDMESDGENIFGADAGGMYPHQAVTEAKYRALVAHVRAGGTSNGVGPAQITYPGKLENGRRDGGFFTQAEKAGLRLWVAYDNMVFGFRLIKGYLGADYSAASIQRAGTLYNAGSLRGGITAYGRQLASLSATWTTRLAGASTGIPAKPKPPTSKPKPAPAPATLQRGSKGAAVKALQAGLRKVFPAYAGSLTLDGDFGYKTKAAVQEFQRRSGLTADGIVGPKTRAALAKHGIKP